MEEGREYTEVDSILPEKPIEKPSGLKLLSLKPDQFPLNYKESPEEEKNHFTKPVSFWKVFVRFGKITGILFTSKMFIAYFIWQFISQGLSAFSAFYVAPYYANFVNVIVSGDLAAFRKTVLAFFINNTIWGMITWTLRGVGFGAAIFRRAITFHIQRYYVKTGNLYKLGKKKRIPNPDERIAEDVDNLCKNMEFLYLGGIGRISRSLVGIYILSTTIIGWKGILAAFGIGILLAVANAGLLKFVVPYVSASENKRGNYRYAHSRLRIYAESIAFFGDKKVETESILNRFASFLSSSITVSKRELIINTFSSINNFFPFDATFFGLQLFFGAFAHTFTPYGTEWSAQFNLISLYIGTIIGPGGAITLLIYFTKNMSAMTGSLNRVMEMLEALQEFEEEQNEKSPSSSEESAEEDSMEDSREDDFVELSDATIHTPDGKLLVQDLNFRVERGKSLLIIGNSGAGKTSILRVLAGLWNLSSGIMKCPKEIGNDGILFLPQKPFMVIGNLKDQLIYPDLDESSTSDITPELDSQLTKLLKILDLSHLKDIYGWKQVIRWENVLSLGEQQRICLLRLLYHKPRVAVLDESTSALNIELVQRVYSLLSDLHITFISVGNPGLSMYHDQVLELDGNGGWKLLEGRGNDIEEINLSNIQKEDSVWLQDETASEWISHHIEPERTFSASPKLLSQQKAVEQKQSIYSLKFLKGMLSLMKVMMSSRASAFLLVGIIVVMILQPFSTIYGAKLVAPLYQVDISSKKFFDTLLISIAFAILNGILNAILLLLTEIIQVVWYKSIVMKVQGLYFENNMFYVINNLNKAIDNPDQRIADDSLNATGTASDLFFGILKIFLQLAGLAAAGNYIHELKYIYAGTVIIHAIAIAISLGLNTIVAKYTYLEAQMDGEFRYIQSRLRAYSESISFFHSEERERADAEKVYGDLFVAQAKLGLANAFQSFAAACRIGIYASFTGPGLAGVMYLHFKFPHSSSPNEFRQQIRVLSSLSDNFWSVNGIIADTVSEYAPFAGFVNRIVELKEFMENYQPAMIKENEKYYLDGDSIIASNIQVSTPEGRPLIQKLSFNLSEERRILIMGPSGCGKSSLLRVLAGLWIPTEGILTKPFKVGRDGILFLPQAPYLVLGPLRDQITYPHPSESVDTEILQELLSLVNLDYLKDQLDMKANWEDTLSLGEQQRLCMLRVFFNRPRIVVLDECTSALDEQYEHIFYSKLIDLGIDFISVGHHLSLVQYHKSILELKVGGSWQLKRL